MQKNMCVSKCPNLLFSLTAAVLDQVGFLRENLRNYRLTTASILRGGVYCMRRANKQ